MITYDIAIEDYHRSKRVSHSKLKTLSSKGPRGYYVAHEQSAWREDDKESYLVGRALEDAIQRPLYFRTHYAAKPAGMTFTTKEGKAWRDAQRSQGLEILDADEVHTVATLVETLEQSVVARALIDGASAQASIIHDRVEAWPHLPGLQARPDWLSLDGCAASDWRPYTLDLKSTLTLPDLSSGRSVVKFGYHSQAASVEQCLRLEGIDCTTIRHFLLGAEKSFPHRWRVVELPPRLVAVGGAWCTRLLNRLNECYATGEFPLVESEIVMADIPSWLDESEAA